MKRGKKRWLISTVVASALVFGVGLSGGMQSKAATIYGACKEDKSLRVLDGSDYYKVAYEVYSNAAGASSKVAGLAVEVDRKLNENDTINIVLQNAKFNPDESVYYALLVDNATSVNTLPTGLVGDNITQSTNQTYTNFPNSFEIAAITSSTITTPTENISFSVTKDGANYVNVGKKLVLVQLVKTVDNGTDTVYEIKRVGSGINVAPNLDASCSNYPEIKVNFTAPNDKAENKLLAKILPKCGVIPVGVGLRNLTAELNTDDYFRTFKNGASVEYNTEINTCEGKGCGVSTCAGCEGGCPHKGGGTGGGGAAGQCPLGWIVGDQFVCDNIVGQVSFTLDSISQENGITVSYGDENGVYQQCNANGDNTEWICSATVKLGNSSCVDIKTDGTTPLTPTQWTIKNMTVTNTNYNVCYTTTEGDAGTWYGGLAAIVPFVKWSEGSTTTYKTYIKLFNRYDKEAKVYAAAFTNASSAVMLVATTEVATIEPGKSTTINVKDLANALGIDQDTMADGFAVKFMIMVPSGKGCENVVNGGMATYDCYNNSYDPYVDGSVISVVCDSNGCSQRSIPLKFKFFENGAYNE